MGTLSFAGIFRVAPNDNITAKFLEVSKIYRDYIILGISPTSFRVFPFDIIQESMYLCTVNIKKQTIMKKIIFVTMVSLLTMSSCSTYTGNGAITGGMFGAMIGSSIGGISGGWRGSHVGQVVGMAGGAVVGAAIGAAE